jgi:tartrate-resistant acid phosphatase type 5
MSAGVLRRGSLVALVAMAAAFWLLSPPAAAAGKPRLSVTGGRISEGNSGTKRAIFRVRLKGATSRAVRVRFATVNGTATAGSDYSSKSGRLVFKPGQKVKTVAVLVRGDTVFELDETFFLRLRRPVGARLGQARAALTIVDDDNGAPLPAAGPDQSVYVVGTAKLDGSGSTDPDGDPLTYSWSLVSRPAASAAALTGAASAKPEFGPDEPGVYVVQLAASDGSSSSVDTVSVTAVSQVVRFAALGDMGQGSTAQTQVAAAMDEKCEASGCDYIIGLGDNIYDSGVDSVDDTQFATKFETPYQNIELDFWMLLGNHDYGSNGDDPVRAGYQVDYTARSTKWKMPARFYRRTDEHVEFFTLDTSPLMFGEYAAQESAVSGWLSSSSAYWKIAVGHHTYRSNGPHGNAGSYDGVSTSGSRVKDLVEDHVCGKAQVYFAGHDHNLQWPQQDTVNCPGTELIISGAGASTKQLTGMQATNFENDDVVGFVYVVIRDRDFTAEFIDSDGNSLFTRTITR